MSWIRPQVGRPWRAAISPYDPLAVIGAMLLLGLAAVAAVVVPARRAARIDPVAALKADWARANAGGCYTAGMRGARLVAGLLVAVGAMALLPSGATRPASDDAAVRQRRGGRRGFGAGLTPWVYDGRFIFCRLAFQESSNGDGGGWSVDYPKADLNFPFRLRELTTAPVSRDGLEEPNHVIVTPTDPNLFQCPFLMATEPGAAFFDEADALSLRAYFEKGGFLWADDFWGEYAWSYWLTQIQRVLPPDEFPLDDLPLSHPMFTQHYIIRYVPQIPSINFWFNSGQTSERADSTVPHVRAIANAQGRVLVLMTHNTDFGDAFEREGEDRRYFDRFASEGYGFGVNAYLYAMTH